ncbi:MAG: uncharacterized protein QOJ97_63 [Solirubrobacteraceae bacterium]|jgi:predicted nucleic acid-binding protein|nr:uncharacterized protein [Solirubrobacteraceae bacterium]
MDASAHRAVSRVGYVETLRALTRAAGERGAAPRNFLAEWPLLDVVELDELVAQSAARMAVDLDLRTLDAVHLASAMALPGSDLVLATWDQRLWNAAREHGVAVLPEALSG